MCNSIIWKEENHRIIYSCPVFKVGERICRSPENKLKTYTVLDTSDWAITIPVLETEEGRFFIMVRQWRPGIGNLSLEFPGGVFNQDENSLQAAQRELKEETGYTAGKITKLGEFSPNPAIMSNTVHFFLGEELVNSGIQNLDDDEYVKVEKIEWETVFNNMGKPPYSHALMGTAMMLYLRHKKAGVPSGNSG